LPASAPRLAARRPASAPRAGAWSTLSPEYSAWIWVNSGSFRQGDLCCARSRSSLAVDRPVQIRVVYTVRGCSSIYGSDLGLMENRVGESSATAVDGGGGAKDSGSFECNICLELAQDPVVTLCGHLFCWPCLYEWLHVHAHSRECPVCKAGLEEEKLVPLYGRGKASTDPRSRSVAGVQIPSRPAGQRPATAPQPDHHHDHLPHHDPWFMGGAGAPVAGGRWGNYTFSAAIGGLFPLLSFQVHGFPQAAAYGPAAGFPYGYGHSFHGWHGHGFPHQAPQGQHVDVFLKVLLVLVGVLVIASLIVF
ncbi:hypothetical protein EE612_005941, partial [Oryza sativa]